LVVGLETSGIYQQRRKEIGNPTILGGDKKLVIAKGKKPPEKLTNDQKLQYYREKYNILHLWTFKTPTLF